MPDAVAKSSRQCVSSRHVLLALAMVSGAMIVAVLALAGSAVAAGSACYTGLITKADGDGELIGSECADVIVAPAGVIEINGGDGDDVIIGGPDTETISGGDGSDYVLATGGGYLVNGGAGDDVLEGNLAPDLTLEEVESYRPDPPSGDSPAGGEAMKESTIELLVSAALRLQESQREQFLRDAVSAIDAQPPVGPRTDPKPFPVDTVESTGPLSEEQIQDSLTLDPELAKQLSDGTGEVDQDLLRSTVDELQQAALSAPYSAFESAVGNGAEAKNADQTSQAEATSSSCTGVVMFGGRGNDPMSGGPCEDRLFGGLGDDTLTGFGQADFLAGDLGFDVLNGGEGDDIVRGDASGDQLLDGGPPTDRDTLSFASAATPGFTGSGPSITNFPGPADERGVSVNIGANSADNGLIGTGGGTDNTSDPANNSDLSKFEAVIGTPYSDHIVGTANDEILEGGGASDVIAGGGGGDLILGDAGGDNLTGAGTAGWIDGGVGDDYCADASFAITNCETGTSSTAVSPRDTGSISVGITSQTWAGQEQSQAYVVGSTGNFVTENGADTVPVQATLLSGNPVRILGFTSSSTAAEGQFSLAAQDETPGCAYSSTLVLCAPPSVTTTLNMAGMGSNDVFSMAGDLNAYYEPDQYGGQGNDTLLGSDETYDYQVDGSGSGGDFLAGFGRSDGFLLAGGADTVYGGENDDLVVSTEILYGKHLQRLKRRRQHLLGAVPDIRNPGGLREPHQRPDRPEKRCCPVVSGGHQPRLDERGGGPGGLQVQGLPGRGRRQQHATRPGRGRSVLRQ